MEKCSEDSQSKLSEPLSTTTFDTATHATAGDILEVRGETYISVPSSAYVKQAARSL
jgi:hypothetical protein